MRILLMLFLIPAVCSANMFSSRVIVDKTKYTPDVQIGIYGYLSTKIKKYTGGFISGIVYGKGSIGFNVVRESAKRDLSGKLDIDDKTLLTVSANATSQQIADNQVFLNGFKNFIQKKIVQSETNFDGLNLSRFDYLDANGKIRMSVWFDQESGFLVQRSIFDESENLISLKIYFNLQVDDQSANYEMQYPKERFEKWSDFCKDRPFFDFNSIDAVRNFIEDSNEFHQ